VTVGDGYKREPLEKGVTGRNVSVITNGVDTSLFHPRLPEPNLERRLGLHDRFVCAYVGTIGMACGLDVVIRLGVGSRNLKS